MRRDDEFFSGQELVLVYIAKKLREAKKVEELLDNVGLDYLVEPDRYRGGVLFVRELMGAFFYLSDAQVDQGRTVLTAAGYTPYEAENPQ
jgi:hypothetical protein